jgi:thiamine biosynthesis lipoprotein
MCTTPRDQREVETPPLQARDLRAMNTDIRLVAAGVHATRRLDRAAAWLRAFEARFSRFRAGSELSRMNAASGGTFRASPALFRFVRTALDVAARTGGLFDPTILRPLEAAGYDRSFELITSVQDVPPHRELEPGSWRDVVLDAATRHITLPRGIGIDLGGIGKGYAVDRVAATLGTPCLVNCGGDLFARGRPSPCETWRVGVSDPFSPDRDIMVLDAEDRAVATSSTMNRRWTVDGSARHHVIDPRTGRPSLSDAVQVTVLAPSALEADVHAKVALILGAEAGVQYLTDQPSVEGLVVRSDGTLCETRQFRQNAT